MRSRKGVRSLRDLHEDFVRLDHADFRACTLFDHFQTIFEVVELSAQAVIGQLRGSVLLLLFFQGLTKTHHVRDAAATKPQLALQHEQQGNQHKVEWTQHHA